MNTILKKIAFIVLLFCCSLGWAQQFVVVEKPGTKAAEKPVEKAVEQVVEVPKTISDEEYKEFLNYSPKSFTANLKSKPQNRMLEGDLNSIGSLELRYAYQLQLKLNESEIKWMEKEIDQLAIAFFAEGKPILIKKTGSYDSCMDRGIETEDRNGLTVTILKFCYTCAGAADVEDKFLEIFNKRTEQLLAAKSKKE